MPYTFPDNDSILETRRRLRNTLGRIKTPNSLGVTVNTGPELQQQIEAMIEAKINAMVLEP